MNTTNLNAFSLLYYYYCKFLTMSGVVEKTVQSI